MDNLRHTMALGLGAMAEFAGMDGREGSVARDMSMLQVTTCVNCQTA